MMTFKEAIEKTKNGRVGCRKLGANLQNEHSVCWNIRNGYMKFQDLFEPEWEPTSDEDYEQAKGWGFTFESPSNRFWARKYLKLRNVL